MSLDPMPTYTVHVHRLDPTLAELHVVFNNLPADVEVSGRLMGPRCPGVSTVEIAYPLRPLEPAVYRVVIPEPITWSADRPFVYEGPAEFRRDGQIVGKLLLSCGIKTAH